MTAERADGTMALRQKLLSARPSDFGLAPTAELPHVWGTIMEMRVGKGVGGEHESVRAATVSFAVLTYDGLRGARDHEQKVKDRQSPLWPAFYLGQDVITALRLTTEKSAG